MHFGFGTFITSLCEKFHLRKNDTTRKTAIDVLLAVSFRIAIVMPIGAALVRRVEDEEIFSGCVNAR